MLHFIFQTPRTFCAANTEDFKFVLDHIHKNYPGCPVIGVGISMGGYVVCNCCAYLGAVSISDTGT